MAQAVATARLPSSASSVPKLPQIEHPQSRLSNPERIDVRGMSRMGDRPVSQIGSGRPMVAENGPMMSRQSSRASQRSCRRLTASGPAVLARISENGHDMPVDGQKSPGIDQIASERLEIDELETILRDKMKVGFVELKKRFVDNDPESQGNVSREAFQRILFSTLGRPISNAQTERLCQRLGVRLDKGTVSFSDLMEAMRQQPGRTPPRWLDPVQRNTLEKVKMDAAEVHQQLQARMQRRFMDVADMFPQFIDFGTGRLMRAEFRNSLNKMHFFMEDEEFDKLWRKYDPECSGAMNAVNMLKTMGIAMKDIEKVEAKTRGMTPAKFETERKKAIGIERFLKSKFREGFNALKQQFQELDSNGTGIIGHDSFISVLEKYGVSLEKKHLAEFLTRCEVEVRKDGVPYRDFLMRFQDRSDGGVAHRLLSKTRPKPVDADDPIKVHLEGLETQLMNMFQRDFLALLASFKKFDLYDLGLISQSDFRSAIEERFQFNLTDEQFTHFMDNVPLDDGNLVKYSDFMKQFDTRGLEPSLFMEPVKEKPVLETTAEAVKETMEEPKPETEPQRRSVSETYQLVKQILNTRFHELDRQFFEMEEYHSQRMTQSTLVALLEKLNVQPPVTRPEVNELWKTFLLQGPGTLDYSEFLRTFIYNPNTSQFPNAKVVPPRIGDDDYRKRSNKLYGTSILLHENLRMKIDYMWEKIRSEFVEMDPYGTGCVSAAEFQEVLRELCVQLQDYELEALTEKFCDTPDGRVNYVRFLLPYGGPAQPWRHGSNMAAVMQHPRTPAKPTKVAKKNAQPLAEVKAKLGDQIKTVRRAFRKLDSNGKGVITAGEFRSVMKLSDVSLDEEMLFHVMSSYDPKMEGKVNYVKFMDDIFGAAPVAGPSVKKTKTKKAKLGSK